MSKVLLILISKKLSELAKTTLEMVNVIIIMAKKTKQFHYSEYDVFTTNHYVLNCQNTIQYNTVKPNFKGTAILNFTSVQFRFKKANGDCTPRLVLRQKKIFCDI